MTRFLTPSYNPRVFETHRESPMPGTFDPGKGPRRQALIPSLSCRSPFLCFSELLVSHGWSDTKDAVRRAVDIVELVGQYVQLRRSGRNYVGLCPWHDDARPSLQVNPERQSFKCWVCDIGGDVFSFTMKVEGVDFGEALHMLAERAGVTLKASGPQSDATGEDPKRRMLRAMAWAARQYHECLLHAPEAQPARDYLAQRGITPESIEKYQLGYAPESWSWLLDRARGSEYSPPLLETVGLAAKRESGSGHYDRFRGRVLFTIRDTQARPVAFGGRVLPGAKESNAAKYINSPETPLFSKSNLVYGLDIAREACSKTKQVVVVEGYTDAIIAHQCGFAQTVAVLGTALGERHIHLLKRYADRIVLVLDGDEAGQRRTSEVLELFVANAVDLRVLTLPDQLDPCDYLHRHGAESFGKLLAEAADALEFRLSSLTRPGSDLSTHAAHRAVEEVLSTIAKAPRLSAQTDSSFRLRSEQVIHRLSRIFDMPEEVLRNRLRELRTPKPQRTERRLHAELSAASSTAIDDPWERELLEVLVQQPMAIERVLQTIGPAEFRSEACRRICLACADLLENEGEADFQRLLLAFDEPEMKSLLVDLDELGTMKRGQSVEDRLEMLLSSLQRRRQDVESRRKLATLRDRKVDEQEGVKLLLEAIQQGRTRHCISDSTDG